MVIDKFGEPTSITKTEDYDEYYYDFGVFTERLNYFSQQISTVSPSDSVYNLIENEGATQHRIKTTKKYIKFRKGNEKIMVI